MSIGVYARIRPEAEDDGDADERLSVLRSGEAGMETKGVLVRNLEFQLDWVFDEAASQEAVYDIVGRDRVARILSGYNVAILAYGQTGSGKTHTVRLNIRAATHVLPTHPHALDSRRSRCSALNPC